MTIAESFAALLAPTTPEGAAFVLISGLVAVWFLWKSARGD